MDERQRAREHEVAYLITDMEYEEPEDVARIKAKLAQASILFVMQDVEGAVVPELDFDGTYFMGEREINMAIENYIEAHTEAHGGDLSASP